MEEILTFNAFLELPNDLQLDEVVIWGYQDGAPWDGWTVETMGALVGLGEPVHPGRRPSCRLFFRAARAPGDEPHRAAHAAFADWFAPLDDQRPADHRDTERARRARTVAAVSIYETRGQLPTEGAEETTRLLGSALAALDDFLLSLGMGGDDALLGSLAAADLPGVVPYTAEVVRPDDSPPRRTRGEVVLHEWRPKFLDIPRERRDIEQAAAMLRAWREGREPAFPVLELCHAARRDALAGRLEPAVIAAGTAIEVLVELVLRRGWEAAGLDGADLAEALDASPRDRLATYLAKVLATPVDVTDGASPPGRWVALGSSLRNRVVHAGYRPTLDEAAEALDATYELVTFIGAALDARPELRDVAGRLPIAREPTRRYAFLRAGE